MWCAKKDTVAGAYSSLTQSSKTADGAANTKQEELLFTDVTVKKHLWKLLPHSRSQQHILRIIFTNVQHRTIVNQMNKNDFILKMHQNRLLEDHSRGRMSLTSLLLIKTLHCAGTTTENCHSQKHTYVFRVKEVTLIYLRWNKFDSVLLIKATSLLSTQRITYLSILIIRKQSRSIIN